jgi:predicted Zn-dependent protease
MAARHGIRACCAALLASVAWFALADAGVPQSQDPFLQQASEEYESIVAKHRARGWLDDPATIDRIRRITSTLIDAASRREPSVAQWKWQVHSTRDPSTTAFCMAGGKILVGDALIERLRLSDGELAMLIAHEMGHALAGHRRERAKSQSPDSDPAGELRETKVAMAQESEADEIGLRLANDAGWPASSLVGFFDKLAEIEPAGTFNSTHASASVRAENARALLAEMSAHPPK